MTLQDLGPGRGSHFGNYDGTDIDGAARDKNPAIDDSLWTRSKYLIILSIIGIASAREAPRGTRLGIDLDPPISKCHGHNFRMSVA